MDVRKMKITGCMCVKNEEHELGLTARVALTWCDELVILDNGSYDRSHSIIVELEAEYEARVALITYPGPWHEMPQRQRALETARAGGATHITIVDADEVLTGNLAEMPMHRHVQDLLPGHILQIPLYNLRGGINRYHANGLWGENRIVSVAFADDPALGWAGDRFHAREPQGKTLQPFQPVAQGSGGVMHLWGANERRLLAKHALYKVTERLRWPEKDVRQIDFEYSQCVKGGLREDPATWTFNDVPDSWWAPYSHLMRYLDIDA
jgi:hypothetical protein